MRKKEIKDLKDNDLITESIKTFAFLIQAITTNRETKMLEKHFNDLGEEMIKRKIITEENWNEINM